MPREKSYKTLSITEILKNSGLISEEQIQQAFEIQKTIDIGFEEIFHIQEIVDIKTTKFFKNKWKRIKEEGAQFPLGYYLQQAFLLNINQIKYILEEQKKWYFR